MLSDNRSIIFQNINQSVRILRELSYHRKEYERDLFIYLIKNNFEDVPVGLISYYDKIVTKLYYDILGHIPDAIGKQNAINRFIHSQFSDMEIKELIRSQMLNSKEYQRKIYLSHQVNSYKIKDSPQINISNEASYHELKIRYYGVIGKTGYANATRKYLYSLYDCGMNINFRYIHIDDVYIDKTPLCQLQYFLLNQDCDYDYVIIHSSPSLWPPVILNERKKNPRVKFIGLTVWETTKIRHDWIEPINMVDLLIVPCEWNKEVFERSVDVKVRTIHHPICCLPDPDTFDIPCKSDDYIFYTISEWNKRKNILTLLECYFQEFTSEDNVFLYIKTNDSPYVDKDLSAFLNRTKRDHPRFCINQETWTEGKIMALHHQAHCFISLCHSEGVGLGACEATLLNKPVIITEFGGQLDYLRNIRGVKYTMIEANECPEHNTHIECISNGCNKSQRLPGEEWADPSLQDARKAMREHYSTRKSDNPIGQKFIQDNFNQYQIGKRFAEVFKEIDF